MYGEVSKGEATPTRRPAPRTKAVPGPPEDPGGGASAAATKMNDSAPNKTVEERLAGVEAKTDLLRQDFNEFKNETRSGFSAVRADMRDMEVRLCKRQDEATATLRAEFKDTTDGLRKEFQDTTDGLRKEFQDTTDGLRKEFQDTTDGLRKEFQNTNENLHQMTLNLRKETHDTTVSLRQEIQDRTESLRKEIHDMTVSLTKEFQKTAERLSTGVAEVRGYVKGLYVAIVPLTIAVLGLMVHLALRG